MSKNVKKNEQWEDITDIFHEAGASKVKVGNVLNFDKNGTRIQLKVVSKKGGKIFAIRIATYDVDRVMSHYGHEIDVTTTPPYCATCNTEI